MGTLLPIQDRTFKLGVRIITMVKSLPRNPAGFALGNQIIRSGTSIGANIIEAQDAMSKPDFIHCMNIALKEARETDYLLKMIVESGLIPKQKMALLLAEIEEIVKILRASLKKLKGIGKITH